MNKERQSIQWNRQSANLEVEFKIANIWSDFQAGSLQMSAHLLAPNADAVRPRITATTLIPAGGVWKRNEVRKVKVQMQIFDHVQPWKSRIPSNLDIALTMVTPKSKAFFVLESEVIVPITEKTLADETYSLENLPQTQITFLGLDELYDQTYRVDYLISEIDMGKLVYRLFVPDQNNRYSEKGQLKVTMGGDQVYIDAVQGKPEFALQRMMWGGQTFYGLGIRIDRSADSKPSEARWWLLDANFKTIQKYSVSNDKVSLPRRVFWTEINNQLRPVWLGVGKDPKKKPSLIDDWEEQVNPERSKRRIYYFDGNNELSAIDKHNGLDVLDVLDTPIPQRMSGSIQLLLGKNHGTESKPSYLNDYHVGDFKAEQITHLTEIMVQSGVSFTNLAEGTQDPVMSLDKDQTLGTSWAASGIDRHKNVTVLISKGSTKSLQISSIGPIRGMEDGVLHLRSAFAGGGRVGGFAFTNSEIQYHDLVSGKAVGKSWERYSFFDQYSFAAFHFPMVLSDRDGGTSYPALYVTESLGFSKGVTVKTVQYNQNGPIEILSPAKLRFQSEAGCKPLENPVRTQTGGAALDYWCGDKLLRMKLEL